MKRQTDNFLVSSWHHYQVVFVFTHLLVRSTVHSFLLFIYSFIYLLCSGAVAAVTGIANPVSLARHVMQDSSHCFLVGSGALKYAKKIGFPILSDPLELISDESRLQLEGNENFNDAVLSSYNTEKRCTTASGNPGHDTVGAVAMDSLGRLACATSTG